MREAAWRPHWSYSSISQYLKCPLQYFFETQPIPNPLSVYFHHLPHPILQFGVLFTFDQFSGRVDEFHWADILNINRAEHDQQHLAYLEHKQ